MLSNSGKFVGIDITGTLLHHDDLKRPVPLMLDALHVMRENGWDCHIVTRWSESRARELLHALPGIEETEIHVSDSKGAAVKEILDSHNELDELVFIDDKPNNIRDVCSISDNRVRTIGFVGSGKYSPDLARTCHELGVELAFNAPDLAELLDFDLPIHSLPVDLVASEWASLIPGLCHPLSALKGETNCFDHRVPFGRLSKTPEWWTLLWPNLAWIGCSACMWKALVRSAIAAAQVDSDQILGDADEDKKYTQQIKGAKAEIRRQLAPFFKEALNAAVEGIKRIGPEAAACRPNQPDWEPMAILKACDHLNVIYGAVEWVTRLRVALEKASSI